MVVTVVVELSSHTCGYLLSWFLLFFSLPFSIQVLKGLIPLKTEKMFLFSFRKLQLASAGADDWNEGSVKARRLNSQVSIRMLPSDGGVEWAPVRTCSPFATSVQFFCSLLCLTRQIDCCAPSQLVSALPFGAQQKFGKVASGPNLVSSQHWFTENCLKSEAAVFQDTLTFILPNHLPRMEQC